MRTITAQRVRMTQGQQHTSTRQSGTNLYLDKELVAKARATATARSLSLSQWVEALLKRAVRAHAKKSAAV